MNNISVFILLCFLQSAAMLGPCLETRIQRKCSAMLYDMKTYDNTELNCNMCKYVVSDIQSENIVEQRTLVDQTWIDKCKIFYFLKENCTDLLKKHYNNIAARHLATHPQTVCHKFGYCTDSGPTVSTRLQKVIGDLKTGAATV